MAASAGSAHAQNRAGSGHAGHKKPRPLPAGAIATSGEREISSRLQRVGRAYQLKRGPTNHWVSPSANFTSPLMPQFWLNFTCAPRRP